jgi:hypothetical protein
LNLGALFTQPIQLGLLAALSKAGATRLHALVNLRPHIVSLSIILLVSIHKQTQFELYLKY